MVANVVSSVYKVRRPAEVKKYVLHKTDTLDFTPVHLKDPFEGLPVDHDMLFSGKGVYFQRNK